MMVIPPQGIYQNTKALIKKSDIYAIIITKIWKSPI